MAVKKRWSPVLQRKQACRFHHTSHINRAIAGVSGLVDFELISPTGISYAGAAEFSPWGHHMAMTTTPHQQAFLQLLPNGLAWDKRPTRRSVI